MGTWLLIGAALAAAVAVGSVVQRRYRLAHLAAVVMTVALVGATARVVVAIARLDFSFVYVAEQSRARSSGAYRLAALWGGAEGSLLLFAAMASMVLVWAMWRAPLQAWGVAAGAGVIGWMAITVAAFANPFARAELPPVRGAGLTPILEHPAMLYHPPILYLGLVVTLVPFAIIVDNPTDWRSRLGAAVRTSMLTAWTLLTIGLATGANWAYVELGWGGYWAWDPVENTVLMPWLVLTAGIHVLRDPKLVARFPRSVVALLLTPFVLVAFGSAVTRSGGLSSVHAFADAAALGWMLGLLVIGLLLVAAWRVWSEPSPADAPTRQSNQQRVLMFSAGLAVAMSVVVMIGVGVPLLPGSNRVVTADFYNRMGVPVLMLALLAMVIVPSLYQRDRGRRRAIGAAMAAGGAIAAIAFLFGVRSWLVLATLMLTGALVVGHLSSFRHMRAATVVGHLGVAVLAVAIASSAQATTVTTVLAPGEAVSFGSDLVLAYDSFAVADGPRLGSEAVTVQTRVTWGDSNDPGIPLSPGLISYPDRAVVLAETALHSTPIRDVQVVARTVTDDGLVSFEVSERPAQMLIWWGSALIALSGPVALATRRRSQLTLP